MTAEKTPDGEITLQLQILDRTDPVLATPCFCTCLKQSAAQSFLLIEEAQLIVPLDNSFEPENIEQAINDWLQRPAIITRGLAFTAREVIKKLKRLGFTEKTTAGSHVQFVCGNRAGKVTVPVHGGEIPKGTLKSILNQAGIDMKQFAIA